MGNLAIRILLADTPRLREQAFRFRYAFYSEEMQRAVAHTDHAAGLIEEPLDRSGHILLALDGEQIIGSLRYNVGVDANFGPAQAVFKLDRFGPFFPASVSLTGRLLIAPAYRGSSVAKRLAVRSYAHGLELGTKFDVISCKPRLRPFFERLGYRAFRETYVDPVRGELHLMLLVMHDPAHLRACRSPFFPFAPAEGDAGSRAFFEAALAGLTVPPAIALRHDPPAPTTQADDALLTP